MILFLDTSVVLRRLLRQAPLLNWTGLSGHVWASRLIEVETRRAIDRLRVLGEATDAQAQYLINDFDSMLAGIVEVSPTVLQEAGNPFPVVIRTLDAIHVVSAQLLQRQMGEFVTVATHDDRLGAAAQSLGIAVVGLSEESES